MGPGAMGRMPSPADEIRRNLEASDGLRFLLDHRKPLEMTRAQRDTLERYRDDQSAMQKPVYRELEKLVSDRPMGAPGGGRGGPEGGRRGAPDGGGRGPESGGRGPAASDTVRALANRLADIQSAFRDRARQQLTATQRTKADSLELIWLEKERKRLEKAQR